MTMKKGKTVGQLEQRKTRKDRREGVPQIVGAFTGSAANQSSRKVEGEKIFRGKEAGGSTP